MGTHKKQHTDVAEGERQKRPSGFRLTETDLAIMDALSRNPELQDSEIADHVHVALSTVVGRLKTLRTRGFLTNRQRIVDLVKTGKAFRYRIDIKINPGILKKNSQTAEQLKALRDLYKTRNPQQQLAYYIRDVSAPKFPGLVVEEVSILLGDPADLCVTVTVPDQNTIFDFVIEELRSLDEIENTSTSQIPWRVFRDRALKKEEIRNDVSSET